MALVFTYPTHTGFIERRWGVLLLMLYAVYLATILQRQAA
ncbi:O-antigen polymerase (fragment) [Candidatus Methylomirabilis oxygeniifera]|uniref:O-antigen polymerase n=1 Tax=Methylomirabilis oxygeniifera TaxID=671143 RepID=D5MFQ4_METO1